MHASITNVKTELLHNNKAMPVFAYAQLVTLETIAKPIIHVILISAKMEQLRYQMVINAHVHAQQGTQEATVKIIILVKQIHA